MKVYVEMFLDHNLGDDLFLDTLLTRYPNHDFYLELPLGMELNPYFKKYKNLHQLIIPKTYKNKLKKKILEYTFINTLKRAIKYDIYILIGGSLFEVRNKRELFYRFKQYVKYKVYSIFKLKKILLGVNIGPFYSEKGEKIVREILKGFTSITVRDKKSLNYLSKWKLKKENYRYGSDIIFSNKLNSGEIKENKKMLGISIVNSYWDNEKERYIKKMVEIIKLYLNKDEGNKIKLLGFDGGNLMSDRELIEEIYKLLNKNEQRRVKKIIYFPKISVTDFLNEFHECALILGGRFHSIILALKFKKKLLAINYSNKIKNYLIDINAEDLLIDYKELNKISSKKILDKLENIKLFEITNEYQLMSNKHFEYIDQILK